jgi:quinoprotein glucose dehydrogenase
MTRRASFAATVTLSLLTLGVWPPADGAQRNDLLTEWRAYAGDQRGSRYSTATDITRDNLNTLVQVWEWKTGERERKEPYARPGQFTTTPLMIGGVLYFATPYNRVIALDAASGEEKWIYDPKAYELGTPALSIGFVHRGVTPWWDGSRLRLFYASRHRLISLDADTGQPVAGFGDGGIVDLSKGLMREIRAEHYEHNSPPLVFNDLVILGSSIGDRIMYKGDPPGQVRAFNARTGKQVWNFNLVPQRGEFGSDTWKNESWRFTGHANAWASMSVDEERGLIYVPTSTPSNDFYGGRRPGDNLFAESLVCLDAATGQRKWHFQVTHHGLWDYDVPAAPTLATVTVNGRRRDIVAQVTKNGFAFVFDRVTGEPIWPIEERPVPQTDVPGEQTARTQPFPTKPPAFVPQGVQLEDAFDLTPAMKSAAQAAMKRFRIGPIYTPPSEEGTLTRPSAGGGANWGGAALDPESGMLFVRATNTPFVIGIARFDKANTNNPYAEFVDVDYHIASYNRGGVRAPSFHDGLPLTKPPYALLTAIDLNTGDIAWQVPAGEGRHIKDHPALKGLTLPARVGSPHPAGVIVTKAGLVFGGGGDPALYAYDAKTGTELWRGSVQRRVSGTPMTYQLAGGRQFVVVATGGGEDAALVAFARPPAP